jgi:tRNA wybutosine-synthesizing protein 1
MTPSAVWCDNKCLHCWRAIELTLGNKIPKEDSAKEIIEKSIEAQRKLLIGFKGNKKINMKKFQEAQNPKQFAISLSGEPMIYKKLGDMIKDLRKRKITSFLVTNGLYPERIKKLSKKRQLPTQLYISVNTPNEILYNEFHRSSKKNAWKKLNESLELISKLKTRTVVRINLVKNLNMEENMIEDYAKLILKAKPMFIELKAYMSVGYARERLGYERMPFHKDIRNFSKKLVKHLPHYKILDEKIESRVILLGKNKKDMKIKPRDI